jgi:hypothetical protein
MRITEIVSHLMAKALASFVCVAVLRRGIASRISQHFPDFCNPHGLWPCQRGLVFDRSGRAGIGRVGSPPSSSDERVLV